MAKQSSRSSGQRSKRGSRGGGGGRGGSQAQRSHRRSVPGWVWLLVGGALGAGALFLYQAQRGDNAPEPVEPSAEIGSGPEASPEAEQEEEPAYEFHELLMEDQVSVPKEDLAQGDERRTEEEDEEAIARTERFEQGQTYLLQAGSFRKHEDAESLRATLALVGLPAQIHTVQLDGGEEWHRVRVGPFEEKDRLEKARLRMKENDIQPMMLREEG